MRNVKLEKEYWKHKTLEEMSNLEWESLCDGCGKCCLYKIEDRDTGEIQFTKVACKLLDSQTCRCSNYKHRKKYVPDCQIFNAKKVRKLYWLPSTCAYRLVAEGKDLPRWHYLVSGSLQSIHNAGASVKNRIISEEKAKNLEDFIIDWIS